VIASAPPNTLTRSVLLHPSILTRTVLSTSHDSDQTTSNIASTAWFHKCLERGASKHHPRARVVGAMTQPLLRECSSIVVCTGSGRALRDAVGILLPFLCRHVAGMFHQGQRIFQESGLRIWASLGIGEFARFGRRACDNSRRYEKTANSDLPAQKTIYKLIAMFQNQQEPTSSIS
jgi:hypothetical protein